MALLVCPKGHESTEPDYCSECGAKMEDAATEAGPQAVAEHCPACGAAREQREVFCEICGFDFASQGALSMTSVAVPLVEEQVLPKRWRAVVSVDAAAHQNGSPEVPAEFAGATVALEIESSLLGRRSVARAIFPEIDLSHDAAVSHRHALLLLDSMGGLVLRDIGASNGTRLNGKEINPMTDYPLHPGDAITLGHWTRVVMEAAE
ncbi:MAG: FHA domain-containing protein [Janthinobacterium lividum]